MRIYDKIMQLCDERGITGYRVSKDLGWSPSTMTSLRMGKQQQLGASKMQQLADYFGVTVSSLYVDDNENIDNRFRIPVLGTVRAGIPALAVEDIIDYEEVSPRMASLGELFALKVKGNSMTPRFCAGDVVIVRKQDDVDNGDIAVCLVGDDATIKKVIKGRDSIMLVANNPSYDPLVFTGSDMESVHIIGKVIELRGKF